MASSPCIMPEKRAPTPEVLRPRECCRPAEVFDAALGSSKKPAHRTRAAAGSLICCCAKCFATS